jgi:hypothetical protein
MPRNRFLVKRVEGRWTVKELGVKSIRGPFLTKPHAILDARRTAATNRPSEVLVEGDDGTFEIDQRFG